MLNPSFVSVKLNEKGDDIILDKVSNNVSSIFGIVDTQSFLSMAKRVKIDTTQSIVSACIGEALGKFKNLREYLIRSLLAHKEQQIQANNQSKTLFNIKTLKNLPTLESMIGTLKSQTMLKIFKKLDSKPIKGQLAYDSRKQFTSQ